MNAMHTKTLKFIKEVMQKNAAMNDFADPSTAARSEYSNKHETRRMSSPK